ncbi:unnamed protein product [Amoebophrya sp. A120]|nr:unnamed protein product [Amoebophrya sp. A120]|eukprot:GSA120T00020483001.1
MLTTTADVPTVARAAAAQISTAGEQVGATQQAARTRNSVHLLNPTSSSLLAEVVDLVPGSGVGSTSERKTSCSAQNALSQGDTTLAAGAITTSGTSPSSVSSSPTHDVERGQIKSTPAASTLTPSMVVAQQGPGPAATREQKEQLVRDVTNRSTRPIPMLSEVEAPSTAVVPGSRGSSSLSTCTEKKMLVTDRITPAFFRVERNYLHDVDRTLPGETTGRAVDHSFTSGDADGPQLLVDRSKTKFLPILTVGDGDLSFSRALQISNPEVPLVATVFDAYETIVAKYPHSRERIEILEKNGATVLFGVDARRLRTHIQRDRICRRAEQQESSTSSSSSFSADKGLAAKNSDDPCRGATKVGDQVGAEELLPLEADTSSSTSGKSPAGSGRKRKNIVPEQDLFATASAGFARVVFQFPLLPAMTKEQFESAPSRDPVLNNRLMLLEFLLEAEELLDKDCGVVLITNKDVRPYTLWRLHDILDHHTLTSSAPSERCEQEDKNRGGAEPPRPENEFSTYNSTASASTTRPPEPPELDDTTATSLQFLGKIPLRMEDFPGYFFQNVDRDSAVKDTMGKSFLYGSSSRLLSQQNKTTCPPSSELLNVILQKADKCGKLHVVQPPFEEKTTNKKDNSAQMAEDGAATAETGTGLFSDRRVAIAKDGSSLLSSKTLTPPEVRQKNLNARTSFYCVPCQIGPFTSEKDLQSHVASKNHQRFVQTDAAWTQIVAKMMAERDYTARLCCATASARTSSREDRHVVTLEAHSPVAAEAAGQERSGEKATKRQRTTNSKDSDVDETSTKMTVTLVSCAS